MQPILGPQMDASCFSAVNGMGDGVKRVGVREESPGETGKRCGEKRIAGGQNIVDRERKMWKENWVGEGDKKEETVGEID